MVNFWRGICRAGQRNTAFGRPGRHCSRGECAEERRCGGRTIGKPLLSRRIGLYQVRRDRSMSKRKLLAEFAALASPYWISEERWSARAFLAAIVSLNLFLVFLSAVQLSGATCSTTRCRTVSYRTSGTTWDASAFSRRRSSSPMSTSSASIRSCRSAGASG